MALTFIGWPHFDSCAVILFPCLNKDTSLCLNKIAVLGNSGTERRTLKKHAIVNFTYRNTRKYQSYDVGEHLFFKG